MRYFAARIALGLVALVLGGGVHAAEPVPIRLGWAVVPASLAPLFATTPGVTRHLGKSYALDLIHFTGTPQQMAGFAADEIDLGSFSYSTFAIAIENAGLTDARIVADILQDGAHGANSNEFMVLKEGPIHAIEDLRGKIYATIGAGGPSDIAIRIIMQRHGLDAKTALTFVEVGFPSMKSMLLSKKVDIITAVTPFSKDAALREDARTLFTQRDAIGPSQLLMMVGHAAFLEKNRAAVVDFLEDQLRAVRWYTDPANHDEAVAIVARFTKQTPSFYQSWLFTKTGDQYRDPDGMPDIDGIEKSVAMSHDFGFLKAPLDVKPYVDLSLVKEAAGRL